jgi:hypothetical protein
MAIIIIAAAGVLILLTYTIIFVGHRERNLPNGEIDIILC